MSVLVDAMDELQLAAMKIERDSLHQMARARIALVKVVREQLVSAEVKPEILAQFDKQHRDYLHGSTR